MIDSEDIRLWLRKADEDYAVIQKLFESKDNFFGGSIGFHSQQCIEKLLKVYLATFDQEIPRTHNLEQLQKLLGSYDSFILTLDFKNLSEFAVKARYPDEEFIPSVEEIECFIQTCGLLRKHILFKIIR